MKKFLALLPAATLALTGCLSSSENNATSASPVPAVSAYPKDFIVTQMGEFTYESAKFELTKATCTDRANEYVWAKNTQKGSLVFDGENVKTGKKLAYVNFGDGQVEYEYNYISGEHLPNATFYKPSTLNNPLIEGFILEKPYYSEVVYINTQCLFQNFGEMQETMAEIAKVKKNEVTMECNKISIQGLTMEYVSHTETSVNYTLSYAGKTCSVEHEFLYAYNKNDCSKAFKNYQQEYENGETQEFFDFELYDQDIHASAECSDVLKNFHNATGLAKSGETSTVSEKQVKDILRAVGARLRGRK